jgi:hypothetical protein
MKRLLFFFALAIAGSMGLLAQSPLLYSVSQNYSFLNTTPSIRLFGSNLTGTLSTEVCFLSGSAGTPGVFPVCQAVTGTSQVLTATVPASANPLAGTVYVRQTNAAAQTTTNSLAYYWISATATPAPVLSTLSRNQAVVGSGDISVSLSGNGFAPASGVGTQAYFVPPLGSPTALSTNLNGDTSVTAVIPAGLLDQTGTGYLYVQVASPVGAVNSTSIPFTVALPSISSVSPPVGLVNSSPTVTLTGAFPDQTNGAEKRLAVVFTKPGGAPVTIAPASITPTQVVFTIPTAQMDIPGAASVVFRVTTLDVTTNDSNAAAFSIVSPPAITSLSPAAAVAGSGSFTLTLNGTNLNIGGLPITVSWVVGQAVLNPTVTASSATAVSVLIPAAWLTAPATATIGLNTGGFASNAVTFTIYPPPSLNVLSPSEFFAGGAATTIAIYGSNLNTGGVPSVRWTPAGGTPQALAVLSSSADVVSAAVTSNLIASAGTATVQIVIGGVASNALPVTIYPSPAITSLTPRGVLAGSPDFVLTVTGQNFGSTGSYSPVVLFGANALYPANATNTSLTVTVPAALVAAVSTVPVTVQMQLSIGAQAAKAPLARPAMSREVAQVGSLSNAVNFFVLGPLNITSLLPAWVQAGSSNTQLIVTGSDFQPGSIVIFSGTRLETSYNSATQLTATIPAALLATAGDRLVSVLDTFNRSSNSLTLPVLPPIVISSLSPAAVAAGSVAFTLTVNGSGFDSSDIVVFEGTALPTVFISNVQVTASVPANLVATAGVRGVAVRDGRGRVSNSAVFTVGIVLQLTSMTPVRVNAGIAGFTLTLSGQGFTQGAVIRFNGVNVPALLQNATTLSGIVPANLLLFPGAVEVRVVNPDERLSNPLQFTILPQLLITALSPAGAQAGANTLTMSVLGQGFTTESVVRANGLSLLTTFISDTHLDALVSDALLAAPGSLDVTVANPPGVVSNAISFGIGSGRLIISSVTPASVPVNSANTPIIVTGSGFAPGTVLRFSSAEIPTQYVSATQLTGTIPAQLLTTVGVYAITAVLGGGVSNAYSFQVGNHAEITYLSPNSITAGASRFTMIVVGSGFISGALVRFGGSDLTATYTSSSQLSAVVPAELVSSARTVPVVVVNPDGEASNSVDFRVVSLSLTSITPQQAFAGGPAFTLSLAGTGFIEGATVNFGGSVLGITYTSASSISAVVPASAIANTGEVQVSVSNPDGARSNALTFRIESDMPVISLLNPSSVTAGSGDLTVNVTGSGFVRGSIVTAGGQTLGTSYNSSTSLDAILPAGLTSTIRTLQFRVTNPGNKQSNEVAFQVTAPAPVISRITPSSVNAGTTVDLTISVVGTGFVEGSSVQFNGRGVETVYEGATSLSAVIPFTELDTPGPALIRVENPGDVHSNTMLFQILGTLSVTAVSPAAILAGGTQNLTITVTGVGFVSGSTVLFNGSALFTTFGSATSLTAVLPPSLTSSAGAFGVSVRNPNGAVSNSTQLRIDARITPPPVNLMLPATIVPAGSGRVQVQLGGNAPVAMAGTLVLGFVHNANNSPADYSDPALLFAATGSRTIPFTIASGSSTAVIPGDGAFSPGTVAGTIVVTMTAMTGGGQDLLPSPAPVRNVIVERGAPSIVAGSVRITTIAGGFQVELSGISSVRDMRSATFSFTSTGISILDGSSLTIDLNQLFTTYFAGAAGQQAGGAFRFTIPFTMTGGDGSSVTLVSVTLTNSIGTSTAVTGGR